MTAMVLKDAALSVRRGECVALRGPSGSGKTTLLALLAGLDLPDGGEVLRSGLAGPAPGQGDLDLWRARSVGYVSQVDPLPRSLPPLDLLRFARHLAEGAGVGTDRLADPRSSLEALVPAAATRRDPATLSGGERRRVAVARALIHRPPLVLADEPAAGLDPSAGARIVLLLRGHARGGAGVLFATHDPALLRLADRVLRLEKGVVREEAR